MPDQSRHTSFDIAEERSVSAHAVATLPAAVAAASGLWLALSERSARHCDAALQSALIFGRGVRAVEATSRGLMCMTAEQEAAAARARAVAIGPCSAVALETQRFGAMWSRQVGNMMLILSMAVQVIEDASVPITHCADELFGGPIAAAA